MSDGEVKVKVVSAKIPKICVCPLCKKVQKFKKHGQYWIKVKDLSLKEPMVMLVQRIRAKCVNPDCARKAFVLQTPGVEKHQRVARRVKEEALDKNILDNIPYQRAASSLGRLNTTGSKSSIDRWKQKEAEKYNFKDIVAKLDFSGILSLDEYKPRRAKHYDLIAGDAVKWHILYLETAPFSPSYAGTVSRGSIEKFCWHLKEFGIEPWAIIFDLLAAYPKQVRKVWPQVVIQYDYFHLMQAIHKDLKGALLHFRRQLKGKELEPLRRDLWENKWRLLKNMDKWTPKDHEIIPELIDFYKGTPVEHILMFKEQIHQIFNNSSSKEQAYEKRNSLSSERWWQYSYHLRKIMKFLTSSKFEHMITYLGDNRIPRSGNIENMISIWRGMEKVRRGFKTEKGRQNHLKLFQLKHYLPGNLAQKSGKLSNRAVYREN